MSKYKTNPNWQEFLLTYFKDFPSNETFERQIRVNGFVLHRHWGGKFQRVDVFTEESFRKMADAREKYQQGKFLREIF